jgi:hypothetical protein
MMIDPSIFIFGKMNNQLNDVFFLEKQTHMEFI